MTDKMVTRCPHCRTAFRIYQHQIEQRRGTVRCGACGGIFDAREHLSMRSSTSPLPAPAQRMPAPDSSASAGSGATGARFEAPAEKRPPEAAAVPAGPSAHTERDRSRRPEHPANEQGIWPAEHEWRIAAAQATPLRAPDGAAPKADAAGVRDWEWPAAPKGPDKATGPRGPARTEARGPGPAYGERAAEESPTAAQTAEATLAAPRIEQRADVPVKVYQAERLTRPPRRGRRWGQDFDLAGGAYAYSQVIGYGVAICLLAAALVVQAILWFRSDIAGYFPGARPFLAQLCRPFQCEVDLPRKIDDLVIDASDLRAEGGVLTLTATLRNRGSMMLALPVIELTVTDERGDAVALRRLPPSDYLGERAATIQGIAAGGELSVVVHIDGSQLAASGYRLLVLYA